MPEIRVNLYEGMFLLNQQHASADFAATVEFVREVFRRAEAEVIALRKWDDRKLAFEVKGQKRAVYLLAYFRARATQIANIERDCNLSEQVLRCMILKADHIGDIELEAAKKDADMTLEARPRSAPSGPAAGAGGGGEGGRRPREEPAAAPAVAAVAAPEAVPASEPSGG